MFDTHLHTEFSTDSKMKIEEAIKASQKSNLGIIVTEHMDLGLKGEEKNFCFDVDEYFSEYNKYKINKVLLGIEIGLEKEHLEEARKIINNNPFDYALGSIHLVDGNDLYYKDFYKDKSKKEAFNRYLEVMFETLKKFDFVDSLGHIDYISRYAYYDDKELYYEDYYERIDEILKLISNREIAMEINTRRLDDDKAFKNLLKIYKRFNELGGKIVTIGSDSHDLKSIGKNFDKAKYIADSCNLKVVYHKNRKIYYDK
ncbi:histidinol phosphate phosphatase [Clostridium oceanicum]|uniref:Histidinol-phosphatase n=1 Tax=Clostridium oceanicum TaxID=1543 RepID=A0ABP3V2S8_9CLOT